MAEKENDVRERLGVRFLEHRAGTPPSSTSHRPAPHHHDSTHERGHRLMDTAEIRRRFLAHFEARRPPAACPRPRCWSTTRTCCSSTPAWCRSSPTSSGQETPPYTRAVSVQKCVRTPDIEDVGKTTRHGTFFEMCGNFSFGDYFKEGAIELAWDLVTKSRPTAAGASRRAGCSRASTRRPGGGRAVDARSTGLPDERIVRLGKKENYWSMGVPGPGGPCSEILYDRGPDYGPTASSRPRRLGCPPSSRTATSRSGTSCSCRTSSARSAARTTSTSPARCRRRTSTPAWAWSGSRSCSRARTTCTRST